jgi:hypothetical protein
MTRFYARKKWQAVFRSRSGPFDSGPSAASSPRSRLGVNGAFVLLISSESKQMAISTSKIFQPLGNYGNKGILTESSSPIIRLP